MKNKWIEPFRESLGTNDRVEVIKINFSDGWWNKWILRGFIQGLTVRNTPPSDRASTFLYFGDEERFRDSLRMHNLMSGYVFLLDGLGYVRFAGSGEASAEEAQRLVRLAQNLTPLLQSPTTPSNPKSHNHHKSFSMTKKKWNR
jgi:mitochondrial ATPase complex subunit ATP10